LNFDISNWDKEVRSLIAMLPLNELALKAVVDFVCACEWLLFRLIQISFSLFFLDTLCWVYLRSFLDSCLTIEGAFVLLALKDFSSVLWMIFFDYLFEGNLLEKMSWQSDKIGW